MSAIAALFNVPVLDRPGQIEQWGFCHAAHHRDIIRVIYDATKIALPEYLLDPIDINSIDNWSYQHQQMHNDMDTILGISGFNLSDVDFKNPSEFAGFVHLNALEHLQAANLLGIG